LNTASGEIRKIFFAAQIDVPGAANSLGVQGLSAVKRGNTRIAGRHSNMWETPN
jgi:hypothetical protein